jgi:hypothetical protein
MEHVTLWAKPAPAESGPIQPAAERAMEAVLFGEILKPLAAALGPFGDVAIVSIAQELIVRPR